MERLLRAVRPIVVNKEEPMDRLIEHCAGLDVHKKTVAACTRTPGSDGKRQQQTRTFATTTKGLLALRDWLAAAGSPWSAWSRPAPTGSRCTTCWKTP